MADDTIQNAKAKQQAGGGIVARLKARFPELSPQLRKAARYAIDNPGDVAIYSMRDVAKRAGVAHSAMLRLAREFGFDGYDAFRDLFRSILVQGGDQPWLDRARSIRDRFPAGSDDEILGQHVLLEMENLQQTFGPQISARLAEAVAELRSARRVYVLGLRSMFPLAYGFHYGFRMFDGRSVLLTGLGGAFADDLRSIGSEDVLLAFSFQPYARAAVSTVAFAQDRGGRIVVVTDSEVSPVIPRNGVSIVVANSSVSLFPSLSAAFTVSQLLVTMLLQEAGEPAMRKLEEAQRQLDRFEVYVP